MMDLLLLILAILPGLLIGYFIYRSDKYEKESTWQLVLSFGLGMIITLPVLKLEEWSHESGFTSIDSIWLTLFYSFVIVALSEELIKFLTLWLYFFRQPSFNEPIDGIIYSVMIAMGFATLENILYAHQYGIETVLLRSITAVPAHGTFAVFMGYFLGLAKFNPVRRRWLLIIALALPVAIHGIYDFFILQEAYDWLIMVAVPILAISIHFALKLIRISQESSPFKPKE